MYVTFIHKVFAIPIMKNLKKNNNTSHFGICFQKIQFGKKNVMHNFPHNAFPRYVQLEKKVIPANVEMFYKKLYDMLLRD